LKSAAVRVWATASENVRVKSTVAALVSGGPTGVSRGGRRGLVDGRDLAEEAAVDGVAGRVGDAGARRLEIDPQRAVACHAVIVSR
jgi:hypothetical protein